MSLNCIISVGMGTLGSPGGLIKCYISSVHLSFTIYLILSQEKNNSRALLKQLVEKNVTSMVREIWILCREIHSHPDASVKSVSKTNLRVDLATLNPKESVVKQQCRSPDTTKTLVRPKYESKIYNCLNNEKINKIK